MRDFLLIRCCLHLHPRRRTAARAREPTRRPGAAACGVHPAHRRIHGAHLHRRARAVHSILHVRPPCALGLADVVAARHLWHLRLAQALISPRVDDADQACAAWGGDRHQPRPERACGGQCYPRRGDVLAGGEAGGRQGPGAGRAREGRSQGRESPRRHGGAGGVERRPAQRY